MSCWSLQFTVSAQGMAAAEETVARVVSVRQKQGAHLCARGLGCLGQGGLVTFVHNRHFSDLRPGRGNRGETIFSVFFS